MKKTILLMLVLSISAISYSQVPEDSIGIWAIINGQAQRMHKISFQKMKVSGTAASGLSFGIAKAKGKLEFKGSESEVQFSGKATFRFYFGDVPVSKITTLGAFTSENSIRDFDISEFQVKKGNRLLTTARVSLWSGMSSGVDTNNDLKISTTEIRDGVYEVEVTGPAGHYCFVNNNYASGGYSGVYDFDLY